MTLDEAIKHEEDVAEEQEKLANTYESFKDYGNPKSSITSGHKKCLNCAEEHRQLAEWLKDYKRLLEQEQTGRWANKEYRKEEYVLTGKCSVCGRVRVLDEFCSNCGARMLEPQEEKK